MDLSNLTLFNTVEGIFQYIAVHIFALKSHHCHQLPFCMLSLPAVVVMGMKFMLCHNFSWYDWGTGIMELIVSR